MFTNVCQQLPVFANLCQSLPIFANVCQCLSMFANVCQCLSMFANVCQCLSMFANVCQCLPMFANVCQCLPMFVNLCQSLPIFANANYSDQCLKVSFNDLIAQFEALEKHWYLIATYKHEILCIGNCQCHRVNAYFFFHFRTTDLQKKRIQSNQVCWSPTKTWLCLTMKKR